jgi:hypothetical protein
MSRAEPTKNTAIKHFQVSHKDGYLIDWLTPAQLEALDNILKSRRGDVSSEYIIEQVLYFMDIS